MSRLAALAVTTAFLTVATGAFAQERYTTPDEAVEALVDAVRTDELRQVMRVLGPGSDEIVVSGDAVADAATRRRFLDAFRAKHQIVPDGEDQAVLLVGEEDWPFPIRLVRLNNTWRFDGQAARRQSVFIEFLKRLMAGAKRAIFLIVDRGPAHIAKKTRAFVDSQHGRLRLFFLPPYSPDRNPDELVWKHLKADTVGRMTITDKADFKAKVRASMRQLQNDPEKIRSFYQKPSLKYAA